MIRDEGQDGRSERKNSMPGDRDIFFLNWVTEGTVKSLIDQILNFLDESPDEPIRLYVTSPGGRYYPAEAFYDFVRTNQIKIETFALSSVNSAAIVIYASGVKRLASETAGFLFHSMRNTFENEEMDIPRLGEYYTELQRLEQKGLNLIRRQCGCPFDTLLSLCQASTLLSAREAKELGLVHDIIPIYPSKGGP